MDSKVYGTLRFTEDRCPFLEAPGDLRIWVAFPANAMGVKSESGITYITDRNGRVYGTEGRLVDGGNQSQSGLGFMDQPTYQVVDLTP